MNKLFIDIETIPAGKPLKPEEIKAPDNYVKPEAILKYQEENVDKEFLKRSVITYKSEIICVCFAFDDEPVQSISRQEFTDEESIIWSLYSNILGTEYLRKDMQASEIIGHNVIFDIKTITQRFFKYGIHALEFAVLHQYHNRVKDTMKMFTLGDRNDYVSLEEVATFLDIEQKKTMKGSDVYNEYKAGNISKIVEYCKGDVELVRKVYNKLTI